MTKRGKHHKLKFETLVPEKKNTILSESLIKSRWIMGIYLYMYITD